MKKRIALLFLAIFMVVSAALPASAARVVKSFYFTLYRNNSTDASGCFDNANGYVRKETSYRTAAIRVDSNTGGYQTKNTLNWSKTERATAYVWLGSGQRATPSYINGYGKSGGTYIQWIRRHEKENAYSTTVTGSWSPDSY